MRKTTVLLLVLLAISAQAQLSADVRSQMDKAASEVLAETGVPSASVAVVKDGAIAYLHAYGQARLEPATPAQTTMRYSIGSISKQFTAAAILLLQQEGKLSLDDHVSKFVPSLTRANEVTIRELLSHTSGYQDYWPQDYVMPIMLKPVTAVQIMDMWAKKPLDFDPGTRWQYSNTNYVIAGAIIEKASGRPYFEFLKERFFRPLAMSSVMDCDQLKLTEADATGYIRYALGPARLAPLMAPGWIWAAGELAMTAEDLAKWDIAMLQQKAISPASYKAMETEVQLTSGVGTQYGLGVNVRLDSGRRSIAHGGEVSGFTAQNVVYPDNGVAVVVLTNQDAASAASQIAQKLATVALQDADTARKLQQAKQIFSDLQQGKIDRSLFTDNANSYFTEQTLKDFAGSLGLLGSPEEFTQTAQGLRGGMVSRSYRVKFGDKTLRAWTFETPDGKLEQYQVAAAE